MCEDVGEEAAFRARCGAKIADWTQQRQTWPVLLLYVITPGGNSLGTGQLMAAVLRFHQMCFRLRRVCYMQVYNSLVSSYFGYADGSSWSTSAIEQAHNSSEWKSLSIEMTMAKRATSAHYIETTLYKQLRNQTAPLLRVNLVGIFSTRAGPGTGSYRAGTTDSMFSSPAKARALFGVDDPCYLRFVTQPRLRERVETLPRAPVVMHLRTGYADADSRLTVSIPINRSAAAAWMEAACGRHASFGSQARVALSDSPGVLRWLAERHGVQSGSSGRLGNVTTLTRTWGGSKFYQKASYRGIEFAAFDDVVVAGFATTLQTAPQGVGGSTHVHGTMFTLPALARSVCVETAEFGLPECPRWPAVFLRDFRRAIGFRDRPAKTCKPQEPECNGVGRWTKLFDMSPEQKAVRTAKEATSTRTPVGPYGKLRSSSAMISEHPCKQEPSVSACYLWQVEAMK